MITEVISYKRPQYWIYSTINSYAVVFFSSNKIFGTILILASLIHPEIGLVGLFGVLSVNVFSTILGLNREHIQKGYFGYDTMLVSCALATFYQVNLTIIILILCTAMLSVFLSLTIHGILHKYQLPALSFPFLFSIWIILSAIPVIPAIQINWNNIYNLNHRVISENNLWLHFVSSFENIPIPELIQVYFKSLASLFFQSDILPGILISIGLLIFSRIAFSLSILGYLSAYFFYQVFGGKTEDFYIHFVGLNFIFQAIAIGGFYLIPSTATYITVFILTPVLILMIFALNKIMFYFGLSAYSLPFTVITILFLYALKFRTSIKYLYPVNYQTFSPEQNLYNHLNSNQRLRQHNYFPIHLPFWGEWMVSQAHDGKITHLGEWGKAFDFIVLDDEMKSYQHPGLKLSDYYCYDKPVIACADGYIVTIEEYIDDNLVNDVNTLKNWGNSIVIYHTENLYSQVSHLKKDSIKVKTGDFVKKGDIIATCGNSGRSPEPHIHFQLQTTPAIGAKTLDYPLAYYLTKEHQKWELKTFEKPKEGQLISNIDVNLVLKNTFHLTPGTKLQFKTSASELDANWEIFTDSYNYSYIYCHQTKAMAYFYNDGGLFYFTNFYGNKNSLLYYFYLAHYKVILGFYAGLQIHESYPISTLKLQLLHYLQDFITPFYTLIKTDFTLTYQFIDDINLTNEIHLHSEANIKIGGFQQKAYSFETKLNKEGISEFNVSTKNQIIRATCVKS